MKQKTHGIKHNTPEINDRVLERYLLDELPGDTKETVTLQLEKDPLLREKLELLKRSNEEILDRYPADSMVRDIQNRVRTEKASAERKRAGRSGFTRRLLYASPVMAMLVVLFLVFQPFGDGTIDLGRPDPGIGKTRVKGTPETGKPYLMVYRKTADREELLKHKAAASAGDLLQLAYAAEGATHGVILSIDGADAVTLHYPEYDTGSTALREKKKVLLSSSYELDDAPRFERFFFITASAVIDVKAVLKQAKKLTGAGGNAETDALDLNDSFTQSSITIIKHPERESAPQTAPRTGELP